MMRALLLALAALTFGAMQAQAGWYDLMGGGRYQHDADIVRLNDLVEIGGYIEEYREKTGAYPLMGEKDAPVYAYIATPEQQVTISENPGPLYEHFVVHPCGFASVLSRGLGRDIVLPFDPQRRPNGRQNFYAYMAVEDRYFLAVHLYGPQPFAQKIGENWYKVEISNAPRKTPLIWDYATLLAQEGFQAALAEPMHKPGYFADLRARQDEAQMQARCPHGTSPELGQ